MNVPARHAMTMLAHLALQQEQSAPLCPWCNDPMVKGDPEADDFDDDNEPTECTEGCGQTMHVRCYGQHFQDCFDDHAAAAYRMRDRPRREL